MKHTQDRLANASILLTQPQSNMNPPIPLPTPSGRTLTQLTNTWKLTALLYDLWRVRSLSLLTGQPFSLERELNLMLEWTQPKALERWLDVGTSTGNYARALSTSGAQVIALDFSGPMLEVAHSKSEAKSSSHIIYRQDFLENLTFENSEGPFDGIAVGATLNEFWDTQVALERMAHLLKPGGRLFMMYLTESKTSLGRLIQSPLAASGVRFPPRQTVKETLERCGMHYARGEQHGVVVLELYHKI